jgi:glycosyltransferase involved in cell wall biosynthesis
MELRAAIEALKEAKGAGAPITLYTDSSYVINGITKRLTLLPNFPDAKRTWLFKQGRVWIHPHTEAFGLDAIAAAAHGLPVIMPPASGAFRLLNSKLSFSDIPKLYSKPSLATTIGQKNYRLAKARFTWENHTRQLLP